MQWEALTHGVEAPLASDHLVAEPFYIHVCCLLYPYIEAGFSGDVLQAASQMNVKGKEPLRRGFSLRIFHHLLPIQKAGQGSKR